MTSRAGGIDAATLEPGRTVFDGEHQTIGVVEDLPHPREYVWLKEPLNGVALVHQSYLSPYELPAGGGPR